MVEVNYPAIVTFTCEYEAQLFPFERQHCRFDHGSWTYDIR